MLLGAGEYIPRIAAHNVPAEIHEALETQDMELVDVSASESEHMLSEKKLDAVIDLDDRILEVKVEGADASKTAATLKQIQAALLDMQSGKAAELEKEINEISIEMPEENLGNLPPELQGYLQETFDGLNIDIPDVEEIIPVSGIEISYLHGDDSWTNFDFFGPVFIGIFIFVFVFLTSSMSLLTERSGGTVARLIATPVKSWQIVGGYVVGFGLLTLVQSAVILWACVSLIGFSNEGSLLLVGCVTVSLALVSLTMGLLVSGLARTPFQVVQLMIVFVVSQILLSGIFDLSQTPGWMQAIASVFPVYYGADALRDVMLRGAGIEDITGNMLVLWGFIIVFFSAACLNFRKKK